MKRTLKVSLVASLLVLAGAAQAQQLCLPHEEAVGRLQRYYGESAKGLGLGNRGRSVLELFVSDIGSWTILVTRTNGLSCIAASGENWTPTETEIPQMAPPIADDGSTRAPRKMPSHPLYRVESWRRDNGIRGPGLAHFSDAGREAQAPLQSGRDWQPGPGDFNDELPI